jgi:hypothetical protein
MKKLILIFTSFFFFNCNVTNQVYELPRGYIFYKGGGSTNCMLRNHEMIIKGGVVDYSYNYDYVFFSADDTKSTDPLKISKSLLKYYIHDIKKDTLYKSVSYQVFNSFLNKNKIDDEYNISKSD